MNGTIIPGLQEEIRPYKFEMGVNMLKELALIHIMPIHITRGGILFAYHSCVAICQLSFPRKPEPQEATLPKERQSWVILMAPYALQHSSTGLVWPLKFTAYFLKLPWFFFCLKKKGKL